MLLITGTDTGVGKTIVTATLAKALRIRGLDVAVRKPFASGVTPGCSFSDDDAQLLREASQTPEPLEQIRPLTFSAPLAPLSAAVLERAEVDVQHALANVRNCARRHPHTLIEGVGGVAVPVAPDLLFSDFAQLLGAPALVVARSALGTINHTLLSVEHLRGKGVPVMGLLFVRGQTGPLTLAEETGPPLAAQLTGVSSFGLLDYSPALAGAQSPKDAVAALPDSAPAIQKLADWMQTAAPGML